MIQNVSSNGMWCAALITLLMCHPSYDLTVNKLPVPCVSGGWTHQKTLTNAICDSAAQLWEYSQYWAV